jgi:hypothetical protein
LVLLFNHGIYWRISRIWEFQAQPIDFISIENEGWLFQTSISEVKVINGHHSDYSRTISKANMSKTDFGIFTSRAVTRAESTSRQGRSGFVPSGFDRVGRVIEHPLTNIENLRSVLKDDKFTKSWSKARWPRRATRTMATQIASILRGAERTEMFVVQLQENRLVDKKTGAISIHDKCKNWIVPR